MDITTQPLTREAFAPFGDVIDVPQEAGRIYYESALGNLRDKAHPSLSVSLKPETPDRPLQAKYLERHEFSSQTFMPLDDVSRYLVIVAPHAADGAPDVTKVKAFIATGKQGITYKANTWHYGLTVLDRPGKFAVFMFRDGGKTDEEFVDVAPFTVHIP